MTYSVAGADAALFDINATTGAITFKSSPNYEAPGDAGGNNVYDVIGKPQMAPMSPPMRLPSLSRTSTRHQRLPLLRLPALRRWFWHGLQGHSHGSGCRRDPHLFDLGSRCFPVQHQCHDRRCHVQVLAELRSAGRCRRQQCL